MKKMLFTALLALVCSFGYGQDKPETQDEIFTVVEQMPEFPGGDKAMFKYLADNLSYPKHAREAGVHGNSSRFGLFFTVNDRDKTNDFYLRDTSVRFHHKTYQYPALNAGLTGMFGIR